MPTPLETMHFSPIVGDDGKLRFLVITFAGSAGIDLRLSGDAFDELLAALVELKQRLA